MMVHRCVFRCFISRINSSLTIFFTDAALAHEALLLQCKLDILRHVNKVYYYLLLFNNVSMIPLVAAGHGLVSWHSLPALSTWRKIS